MDLILIGKMVLVNVVLGILGSMATRVSIIAWIFIVGCILYAVYIENLLDKAGRKNGRY